MSTELGSWLRGQREALGWSRAEMARRLIAAARQTAGDTVSDPGNLRHSIYRWECGLAGVSGPHRLLICRVFGIDPAQFGEHGADGPGQPDRLPESARALSDRAVSRLRGVSFEDARYPPVCGQQLAAGQHLPRDKTE
jgi:transcriptional regulator with XRE-family HTH domain